MAENVIQLKLIIDNKEASASLKLTDDNIKELYKSFKYGKQEVNGLITSISQGFNNAREIIQGFKESFDVISSAFATHLTAYQEQEAALIKLDTALKQTGQYTESNVKALTDYAAKLQQTTIYGDEVTETVMAQLLAMGLTVEQTKQATLQAANLATVMGTDLNTAARAMADLFNGNVGLIGRYVKGLNEAVIKSGDLDKIMAMLNERIGGQAEAMGNTTTGAIERMNNAIGDLKENAGELLSKALAPFVNVISDIFKRLNELSPTMSGAIGLIASITTAFITLRVSGILPAINAIELFGVALTGLKAVMIKTGIGALVIALGYGLYELAKAYEKWSNVKANADNSLNNSIEQIRNEALKAKKEELNWMLEDARNQKNKLQNDIERLKADIQKAKKEVITKDKEGNEYKNYHETDESEKLAEQLKQQQQLLKIEEEKIKIYNEVINKKQTTKKLTEEESKQEFETAAKKLAIIQKHEENVLRIQTDNDSKLLLQKKEHIKQLINLYKKHGQDITELKYQLAETELQIDKEMQIKPLSEEKAFYDKKIEMHAISEEQMTEITREHAKQRAKIAEDLTEFEKWLYDENATAQMQQQADVFNFIATGFNQYTVAAKAAAVFEAILRARLAVLQALEAFPPPINFAMAALVAVAAAKQVNDIISMQPPKAKGFQQGGRLPAGKAGYVEGYSNEIIAPEKTFVEIFRQELRPQIYSNLQYDYSPLLFELREQNRNIEKWQREITFKFENGEFIAGINKLQSKYNRLKF